MPKLCLVHAEAMFISNVVCLFRTWYVYFERSIIVRQFVEEKFGSKSVEAEGQEGGVLAGRNWDLAQRWSGLVAFLII